MAKPILDVEVNDAKFRAFADLFEKYQATVAKMPGAWAGVDKGVKSSFENVAAAMMAQNELARREAKAEKDLDRAGRGARTTWGDLATKSKSVYDNVKGITLSMLRWASIGAAFTGLLGLGGLFGLDRLAGGVGANRRAALGLGVSYGERKAFGVNYGRVVESDSYLANVNEALHDASLRGKLYGSGMRDLSGSTADVGIRLLARIKDVADQTPDGQDVQALGSHGFDQFITLHDFERAKKTSREEFLGYAKPYGQDVKDFGLEEKDAKIWQDFSVQMSRAGQSIENIFVTKLTAIVGPLDEFSKSIVKTIKTFVNQPEFDAWLHDFGEAIKGLARDLASGKIQADVKSFATNIGLAAEGLVNALKWLGFITDKNAKPPPATSKGLDQGSRTVVGKVGFARKAYDQHIPLDWGWGSRKLINAGDLLPMIASAESANGKYNLSPKGARGMYQIMPATAAMYPGKNPDIPAQGKDIAYAEIVKLIKKYSGDEDKILAGYNWGQGNVDSAVAKYGAGWLNAKDAAGRNVVPRETREYIIKIENNTGGNAIVSAGTLHQ